MLKVSKELNAAGEMSGWAFEGAVRVGAWLCQEGMTSSKPHIWGDWFGSHSTRGGWYCKMFNKDEACFQKCIGHGGVTLGVNYIVSTMTFPPKASILATPGL